MTEPHQDGEAKAIDPQPAARSRPLNLARLCKVIANLGEKGGSKASDISKFLSQQYNLKTSSAELKRMLIRAVKAGRVHQTPRTNRFVLKVPASFSRTEGGSHRGRRRRRRRKGGKKAKAKGKKGRKGKGRRRRRGKKGKKGKGKKGKKGKRRRRRRKGKKGKGKR
ncbi:histone H1-beta, late embryonic-like [Littorina saxatilis]|uniref:H15 domain-containing protein n=1 Tax=Littorina saxatilis TaxID=31220 RepID=A0AAN9GLZ2_9CAEN